MKFMASERKRKSITLFEKIEVNHNARRLLSLFIVLIGFGGIFFDSAYLSFVGYINQWILAIIWLGVIGVVMKKLNSYVGWYGMYLLSTKRWLDTIDKISQRFGRFWTEMSIWGMVLGFGILSWPLLKGNISKKTYVFGLFSLVAILYFVLPLTANGLTFINLPQIQSAVQNSASAHASPTGQFISYIVYGITLLTGFSGYIIALLFYNTGLIVYGIGQFLASVVAGNIQTGTLTNQVPGVAPLIPGVNLPLFAGIISLIGILIVHELSHGILARVEKIKLKGVGLVLFGVIPIGAFVEPDEKKVAKLNAIKQTRIFAAGISSNFVAMLVFAVLMLITLYYFVPGIYAKYVLVQNVVPGFPAANVLKPGMQILFWNGYAIRNISSFATAAASDYANSTITVTTNTGTYAFKALPAGGNSTRGVIGVSVYQPLASGIWPQIVYFLYSVFALSLLLNFLVGVVNLLPVPLFDGWRIYKVNIKNDAAVRYLAALIVISLLVNILPWFFFAAVK